MDHEGYPKSIGSHFQSGAQDPSMTCGGGIADFNNKGYYFWRGCPVYDKNFKSYLFSLEGKGSEANFLLKETRDSL